MIAPAKAPWGRPPGGHSGSAIGVRVGPPRVQDTRLVGQAVQDKADIEGLGSLAVHLSRGICGGRSVREEWTGDGLAGAGMDDGRRARCADQGLKNTGEDDELLRIVRIL